LNPNTIDKLVYIPANTCLLNKITAVDYEEENVECQTTVDSSAKSESESVESELESE
jgi:hypothetical protein